MAYYVESGVWSSVFAVPSVVVDQHIRLCSPLALKVLLVLLRGGTHLDVGQLAKILGQSRADVQDAVNYWVSHGILTDDSREEEEASLSFSAASAPSARLTYEEIPDEEDAAVVKTEKPVQPRRHLTSEQINDMALNDEAIGLLLQETQQVLGKPLTPVATDTIVSLYGYYGMAPDLILMLVQYCASIGKDNMRYIEKVASSWLERGVDSHEKAEAEILRLTRQSKMEARIKSAFGIQDRNLTGGEKKYLDTWTNEYNMSQALIELAWERTVELKGKTSFAYINGILTNWHSKNIKTAAQAMQEIGRGKRVEEPAAKQASYEMTELEKLISYGDITK